MSLDQFKNFAKSTLASGIASTATFLSVASGTGTKFPAVSFNATIWNKTDYADPSDDPYHEIVRVTAIATDTFTITRAQEGTTAQNLNIAGKTYGIIAGLSAYMANLTPSLMQPAHQTNFENVSRFTTSTNASGAVAVSTVGMNLKTGTTTNAYGMLIWNLGINGTNYTVYNLSSKITLFAVTASYVTPGSSGCNAFLGIGALGSNWILNFNNNHIGFKIVNDVLYATQANGTTETASAALVTLNNNDQVDLALRVNGTTSVDYWYRVNQGSWSTVNLTTNMPAANNNTARFVVGNENTTNDIELNLFTSQVFMP